MRAIYCDGANNKFGSSHCVIKDYGDYKITKIKDMKHVYNPVVMEYLALIEGLKNSNLQIKVVYSDSLRVVRELNSYKLHDYSRKNLDLWCMAKTIMKQKPYVKIIWIPREENLAGICLEHNLMMKKKEFYKKK